LSAGGGIELPAATETGRDAECRCATAADGQVQRGDGIGQAGHAGENQRSDYDLGDVVAGAQLRRRQFHGVACADHDGGGEHGDAHVESGRPWWMDRRLELLLLLENGL
jgi:hypothetical protein